MVDVNGCYDLDVLYIDNAAALHRNNNRKRSTVCCHLAASSDIEGAVSVFRHRRPVSGTVDERSAVKYSKPIPVTDSETSSVGVPVVVMWILRVRGEDCQVLHVSPGEILAVQDKK